MLSKGVDWFDIASWFGLTHAQGPMSQLVTAGLYFGKGKVVVCKRCGIEFREPAGKKGRPRKFCTTTCERAYCPPWRYRCEWCGQRQRLVAPAYCHKRCDLARYFWTEKEEAGEPARLAAEALADDVLSFEEVCPFPLGEVYALAGRSHVGDFLDVFRDAWAVVEQGSTPDDWEPDEGQTCPRVGATLGEASVPENN